jgi:hypothetical protein
LSTDWHPSLTVSLPHPFADDTHAQKACDPAIQLGFAVATVIENGCSILFLSNGPSIYFW